MPADRPNREESNLPGNQGKDQHADKPEHPGGAGNPKLGKPEHLETGKEGEDQAVEYLRQKRYRILERNWRSGHKEVDIIAASGGELIIVEVKVRRSIGSERIEEHVPVSKQRRLVRAAEAYLRYRQMNLSVRFDLILLTGQRGEYRIEHIMNAYSPWDH
jgi:putative endonuclease